MNAGDAAAIVLGAGRARRFGGGKLVADLAGAPVGAYAAQAVAKSGASPKFFVTVHGAPLNEVYGALGFELVVNTAPERGMGASLALGAEAARQAGARAIFVHLADMPFVDADHFTRLADAIGEAEAAICDANGRVSPPGLFSGRALSSLTRLGGDRGARDLLGDLQSVVRVSVEPPALRDIDTQADLATAEALLRP